MIQNWQKHVDQIHQQINAVSDSFCVAKWKQVTIHLQNGQTHSCHHPNTHHIPISEIKHNPTALHNTEFKKQQRKLMLEGQRPSECDYCWRVEDAGERSDRTFKSADHWAYPYINDIANSDWQNNVDPSYVEVSFSNVCNFKCSYCAPHISSQWMEEIQRFGEYPTSSKFNNIHWLAKENKMPIPNKDDNPYVDAFWQWWPTMYRELKTFRITGGEPLMTKNTFKVLDYIIDNPNTNLNLCINTNLCVPDNLIDKFIDSLTIIQNSKKIKSIVLYTSAEAHGAQSEYIRHGMDYNQWLRNLDRILSTVPDIVVTIMSTYNILSLFSYNDFLQDLLDLRRKHKKNYTHRPAVSIDIPYLRDPKHQAAYIMEPDMLKYVTEQISFMEKNRASASNNYTGFNEMEIYKLSRIKTVIEEELIKTDNKDLSRLRRDFVLFVDEHDRRRGTDFLKTFPEFRQTYEKWKKI